MVCVMADWHIERDKKTEMVTEKRLRAQLQNGDLTGMERVREEGSEAWMPLHQTALFRQEVPHDGDPERAAWRREATSYAWHLGVFLAVLGFLGFPLWGVFWGIGMVGHTLKVLPALQGLLSRSLAPALDAPPAPLASPQTAGLTGPLQQALAALRDTGEDVSEIEAAAADLQQHRLALDAALQEAALPALEEQHAALLAQAGASESAREAEQHSAEAQALAARIAALRDAEQARDRLLAQERALLHQLEGIRLSRLTVVVNAPPLGEQLDEIRQHLRADAEVEEKLASARQAAQRSLQAKRRQ